MSDGSSGGSGWTEAGLLRELDQFLASFALGPHVNTAHFLHDLREQLRGRGTAMVTLFAAREFVMRERWSKDGCRCPACDQNAKVWTRALTTEMARALVKIVRRWEREQRPMLSSELNLGGGDYAKLRYWGLIVFEHQPDDDRRPGGPMWPTPKGVDFARRRISVQKEALVYNGQALMFQGDKVSIDLLPNFDYDAIWGSDDEP